MKTKTKLKKTKLVRVDLVWFLVCTIHALSLYYLNLLRFACKNENVFKIIFLANALIYLIYHMYVQRKKGEKVR